MAAAYQDNRSVRVTSPLGPNVLVFSRLSATERISQPFYFEVALLSRDGELDPDKLLGKALAVSLEIAPGLPARYFHGLVTEFAQSGFDEEFHHYRAVLRPWYWFLTRTADCRIFQGKSVPDIFAQVCRQAGFADLEMKLGSYPAQEYCVQYRETDFNFLGRLLEREGIFYYFEHSQDKHVLVLVDDVAKCGSAKNYESVPYYPQSASDSIRERDHLQSWSFHKTFQSGCFCARDYDFEHPNQIPAGTASIARAHNAASYEIYDFPGGSTQLSSAGMEGLAKLRVQELQVAQMVASGSGDAAGLGAGKQFKLTGYPRSSLNTQYLITSTSIELSADDYRSGRASQGTHFSISLEAVDSREAYRPARLTPKPVVQGTQTAMVVGPAGEEIYTDEFGRIKVQFHWDRYGEQDQGSSCFIRVAQPWAGKNWGSIHIPRIGQEVIVSFLEGDPDRPLVIGSVYNGSNRPPYALPDYRTRSGIISRSSLDGTGENCNEFRFEDKKGSEQVYLHAEKDQAIEVENDEAHSVGHDRRKSVTNDETTSIGANRSETVGGNESISISKNRTESVGGAESIDVTKDRSLNVGAGSSRSIGKDESITVAGSRTDEVRKNEDLNIAENRTQSIGKNDTVSIGKELLIDVGDEIVIKSGEASITMKKDGTIMLKGSNITLEGSGKINIKAAADVVIKGAKITQN